MTESLRILLDGLIDYAGLFPPAGLSMPDAARNYAGYRACEHAFALGRFICKASQLDELTAAGAGLMPGEPNATPWPISAIIDAPLAESLDRIDRFCAHHIDPANGLAVVDAIEMRVSQPGNIDDALDEIPDDIIPAFELPREVIFGGDPRGFAAALAGGEAIGKVRCGGVTPDLIPSTDDLARFINAMAGAGSAFKATAGLHHPVRAAHPLTYEPDAPTAVMHGFVNMFLASALRSNGAIEAEQVVEVLEETDPTAFSFTNKGCAWRGAAIDTARFVRARESFCISYGSCSFTEPIEDLTRLGWI